MRFNPFTAPPVKSMLERQLRETERELVGARASNEDWTAQVAKLETRADRLREELKAAS